MPNPALPPLRFEPILKRHIWGGRRLGTVLHKPIGAGGDYAESWEISDHRDDVGRVLDGPFAGASLHELIQTRGEDLLGSTLAGSTEFPLLVKFIDANQNLSVQVHPNDEQGKRLAGDNGKTEAWVVLDVEPGGRIYAGLKSGTTPESLAQAVDAGRTAELLHSFEPARGDCVLIPAGTVHAIGAGVLVTEIQQTSDATFRIFDWNRVGPDGRPRELHIARALQVVDFDQGPVEPWTPERTPIDGAGIRERLARCPYFALERFDLERAAPVGCSRRDRFTIVIVLGGAGSLQSSCGEQTLQQYESWLLPAALGECTIRPTDPSNRIEFLTCIVP